MKYLILLLMTLSFAAGVLGFTLLAGTAAVVSRIVFLALLVLMGVLFFIPKPHPKTVTRSSFADSFSEELPPGKVEG